MPIQTGLINNVIYFYSFICVALLVFNILYIFSSKGKNVRRRRRAVRWETELRAAFAQITKADNLPEGHNARLIAGLRRISGLLAFYDALQSVVPEQTPAVRARYLALTEPALFPLADRYRRRPPMERAFFAYVVGAYHPDGSGQRSRLSEVLLTYLPDATVYCRENVLRALYALGDAKAVEQAFLQFQDKHWYHYPRLLSDGLATFTGDRAALARRLWAVGRDWDAPLMVAVIQFMTLLPEDLSDLMLPVLEGGQGETRFAAIRYFQRHVTDTARPGLLALTRDGDYAVAACAALAAYPGQDTRAVLKDALRSRNWYVRRNAATALAAQGLSEEERAALCASDDRYAREMMEYVLTLPKGGKGA